MTGIQMVEGMYMVEERPPKELPEVEGIDIEDRPLKERSKVEGMDIVEDMTTVVVEREHEDVVLARHWIGNGTPIIRHDVEWRRVKKRVKIE
jgi:hypothetical protein